jgi:hypothetical protein
MSQLEVFTSTLPEAPEQQQQWTQSSCWLHYRHQPTISRWLLPSMAANVAGFYNHVTARRHNLLPSSSCNIIGILLSVTAAVAAGLHHHVST